MRRFGFSHGKTKTLFNPNCSKFAGPLPNACWYHEKLSFDISPFHFLELFSKLLQSKPTQAAIFQQFFDFESQSIQTWTRVRATIRARVRIRTTIRARAIVTVEKCAREAASLGATGHVNNGAVSNREAPFFEASFETVFSCKNVAKWSPGWHQKLKKIGLKRTLERRSTKRLIPSDLPKTCFRMDWLRKIVKNKGTDKS